MDTELSAKSRENILHHVRQLVEFWSISREELEEACKHDPAPQVQAVLAIKYRHPVSGQTWDGRGAHPDWLRKALLQEGYSVAQLRPEDQLETTCASDDPEPKAAA